MIQDFKKASLIVNFKYRDMLLGKMSTHILQKIYKCKSKSKMKLLGKRNTELDMNTH